MIQLKRISLRYPGGKGIFDVSFRVEEGEVFGYLGPNGAGKTTTIRCLLGFMRPAAGTCTIGGLDCWAEAPQVMREVGYIPGEPAFLEGMSGIQFLRFLASMRSGAAPRQKELLERFALDPSGPIRRMSKGMRQKLAIVAAFQHDPSVLILDEPTSGLDPLMQNAFVALIQEEKARGKTILMSSHNFEETDRTCDRAGIIREGRLVAIESIEALKQTRQRSFILTLRREGDAQTLRELGLDSTPLGDQRVEVRVTGSTDAFLKAAAGIAVENLEVAQQSLESAFMQYYGQEVEA